MMNWKTSYFTCFVLRCLHTVGIFSNDEIHLIGFFLILFTHIQTKPLQLLYLSSKLSWLTHACRHHRCHYHGGHIIYHYLLIAIIIIFIITFAASIYPKFRFCLDLQKRPFDIKKKTHSKTIFSSVESKYMQYIRV